MRFRLAFDQEIAAELVPELEKAAAYATARLRHLNVTPDRRAADVVCEDDAEPEVRGKVERLVGSMVRSFRSLGEPEVLAFTARRDQGAILEDAFAELSQRRWVVPLGRGHVSLAGGAAALKRFLDDAIRGLAQARFQAEEQDHPELIEPEVLARCGYFGSFPHSVSFVSHLTEDFDAIEEFRSSNTERGGSFAQPAARALTSSEAVLRPAVCLPVYRALEGLAIAGPGRAITTTGKAFRYESRNMEGLERLWDFSMREIVFVGTAKYIDDSRARMIDAVTSFMEELDLAARVVSAIDPFFATVRGTKALWQRTRNLKYEVVVDSGKREIAAGSINFAGHLFGDAFRVTTDDAETAATACIGFGLERLILALFAQHGFEAERWPRELRRVVFG
jgi:seryl-tRNA synthetase